MSLTAKQIADKKYYEANKDEINRKKREKRAQSKQSPAVLRLVGADSVTSNRDAGSDHEDDVLALDRVTESDRVPASCSKMESDFVPTSIRELASDYSPISDQSKESDTAPVSCRRPGSDTVPESDCKPSDCVPTSDHGSGSEHSQQSQSYPMFEYEAAFFLTPDNGAQQMQNFSVIKLPVEALVNASTEKSSGIISTMVWWLKAHPFTTFRVMVIVGLLVLLTLMQHAFYAEHDILPNLSWPLAVAGDVAMTSMMLMSFEEKWLEGLRFTIYGFFYVFVIGSTSFDVLSRIRSESKPVAHISPSGNQTYLKEQIRILDGEINLLGKRGAYQLAMAKGEERTGLRNRLLATPSNPAAPLGISNEQMAWVNAFILILARSLLSGAAGLNAVALRQQLKSGKQQKLA